MVTCLIAACGVALAFRDWVPGLAGCEDTGKPTKTSVITEKSRIEQMYAELKPIQAVHWQEREARARSCPEVGPMDYIMTGFATLLPERAAALTPSASLPVSAAPVLDIPDDLRSFAPNDPTWLVLRDGLLLDMASATAYFIHRTN